MMKNNQDRQRKIFTLILTLFILFSLVGFDLPPPSAGPVDNACHPLSDANCTSVPDREQANDPPYPLPEDIKLSSTRVLEGQPINTIVGSFSTIGVVLGPYTYSLVPGEGGSDNGSFNISGDQLRTSAEFNADIKNSYDILVRSTTAFDMFVEKQFRITIIQAGDEMFTYLPLMIRGSGFNSQIDGFANGWVAHSGLWVLHTSGFLFSHPIIGSSSVSYVLNFTNFDYQVMMARFGSFTNPNRIFVRGTPTPLKTGNRWHSGYAFQYSQSGWYSVLKHMPNGDIITLQDWTASSAINTGQGIQNLLRVVANGDHFSYYINGTLVWQGRDSSFSSGRVGIGWYWDGEIGNWSDVLGVGWAVLTPLGTSGTQGLSVPDPIAPDHQTIIDEVFADGNENEVLIP